MDEKYLVERIRDSMELDNALFMDDFNLVDEDLFLIAEKLRGTSIYALVLSRNDLGDSCFEGLKNLKATNVKVLNMSSIGIGFKGARSLASNLQGTNVEILSLYWNLLANKGAKQVSKHLINTNVYRLDLSHNDITDRGIIPFARNIIKTNVQFINLSGNSIGPRGARYLAKILKGSNILNVEGVSSPELATTLRENKERINQELLEIGRGFSKKADKPGMGPELLSSILQWLPITANSPLVKPLPGSSLEPQPGLDTENTQVVISEYLSPSNV